jgi:heat shock protein HslJ
MRNERRVIIPGTIALSLMLFAGPSLAQSDDGGDGSAVPSDGSAAGSFVGSWVLTEVIDQTGASAALPEGLVVTLQLDATGGLDGSVGCRTYAGGYDHDGSAGLAIVDLVVEEGDDCDPSLARWEQEYPRLLESVDEVAVDNGRLVMGTEPWGFDLYFEPEAAIEPEVAVEPGALSAATWQVTDGFPTSQEFLLGFAPDGALSGSTACFDLEGTYAIDGEALTIDAARSGSRDCSTSEFGAADAFLGVLDRVESWSVDEGRLVLGLPDDRYPFDLVLEPIASS